MRLDASHGKRKVSSYEVATRNLTVLANMLRNAADMATQQNNLLDHVLSILYILSPATFSHFTSSNGSGMASYS